MPMLDVFSTNPAFDMIEMSESFSVVPNQWGRLQEMNLFPEQPLRGRRFSVERANGVLNLIPSREWGAPSTLNTTGKRDVRDFSIPHIPLDDAMPAADVQGVRAFGSETEMMALADLLNDKLQTIANKQDITLEYMRWGALNGKVLDADGTELLDLFAAWGETQTVIDFELSTATTEVDTKVFQLKRHMQLNALGQVYTGIHVMCDSGFYDALYTHPSVQESFNRAQGPTNQFGEDYRNGFRYNGVLWEEYLGSATDTSGSDQPFIPADAALAFPTGAMGLLSTKLAPADFIETVNTRALRRYAKTKVADFDRGVDVHTQTNPIPFCTRPQMLVRLDKG